MAIVIPLLIVIVILIGIIIVLMFYPSVKNIKRQSEENKNIPERETADENVFPVSSAANNCNRNEWTFSPAYFTRNIVGSIRSRASNIYDTIKNYDFSRRPSVRSYFRNAKDAVETQGLLDSDNEEKTENDNSAFEEEQMNSDYPRPMMTKITVYDTEVTEEDQTQKNDPYVPYDFTPFNVYNESVNGSCLIADSDNTSVTHPEESPEETWQQVPLKDYENSPSTSELRSNTKTYNHDHSLITSEKSSDTFTSAGKSADEMNKLKSENESVQHKDYSDTGTKSVVPETDNNGIGGNIETMHGTDMPSLPEEEMLSEDNVSVNKYESMDGEILFDHFVTHENKTNDFPLMNNASINKNTTKDEIEGGNNTQLSKSIIGFEFNNELPADSSTTSGLDMTNFAESSSDELENKWQSEDEPDFLPKVTEEFAGSFKPQVNEDIYITMEEENNEIQDNDTDSEEQFLPGPSFETGAHFKQPLEFPSMNNNEHDLSVADIADMSAIPNHQEKKINQPDDQNTSDLCLLITEDPDQSTVSIFDYNGIDDVDSEVINGGNGISSSGTHYEKLKKLDPNPPYAELFPPNMQDILKEMPDSAENILKFSRAETERSEADDDYTGYGYDDDISGYL